jgi:hypothetical protein
MWLREEGRVMPPSIAVAARAFPFENQGSELGLPIGDEMDIIGYRMDI